MSSEVINLCSEDEKSEVSDISDTSSVASVSNGAEVGFKRKKVMFCLRSTNLDFCEILT